MKIIILPSARDDLADGFDFYERQQEGLGNYFQESLFLTLIHSSFTQAFISKYSVFIGSCPSAFLTQFTMIKKANGFACGLFSIVGATRKRFGGGSPDFVNSKRVEQKISSVNIPSLRMSYRER